jgi:hypothetical protein
MGLINNDTYTASNGVEKAGTYIAFSNETLYVSQASSMGAAGESPSEPMYAIRANYRIFWDKAARDAGKNFLDLQSVSTVVSLSQLSNNPYTILYDVLKGKYPNATDELRVAEPVAPVADPVAPVADPVAEPASEPVADPSA